MVQILEPNVNELHHHEYHQRPQNCFRKYSPQEMQLFSGIIWTYSQLYLLYRTVSTLYSYWNSFQPKISGVRETGCQNNKGSSVEKLLLEYQNLDIKVSDIKKGKRCNVSLKCSALISTWKC